MWLPFHSLFLLTRQKKVWKQRGRSRHGINRDGPPLSTCPIGNGVTATSGSHAAHRYPPPGQTSSPLQDPGPGVATSRTPSLGRGEEGNLAAEQRPRDTAGDRPALQCRSSEPSAAAGGSARPPRAPLPRDGLCASPSVPPPARNHDPPPAGGDGAGGSRRGPTYINKSPPPAPDWPSSCTRGIQVLFDWSKGIVLTGQNKAALIDW